MTTSARRTRTWPRSGSTRCSPRPGASLPSGSRSSRGPVQALRAGLLGNGPDREAGIARGRAPSVGLRHAADPLARALPGNTLVAMRVATFAKQVGRAVSFSLAAFRQAFAAGRDLTSPTTCCWRGPPPSSTRAPCCGTRARLGEGGAAGGDRSGRGPRRARGAERRRRRRGVLGRRPARRCRRRPPARLKPTAPAAAAGRARLSWAAVAPERTKSAESDLAGDGRGAARAPSSRLRDLPRAARDDGVDPALRGGGGAPVPAGQGRRLPPPGDRRGGDDRRNRLGDAPRRLPDRHLPHPWPRDRPGNGSEERDGRAVRPRGRLLARARRVDAHLRRRAALHGRLRDRRREPADRRRARAGLATTRARTRSPSACSATARPTPATSARP